MEREKFIKEKELLEINPEKLSQQEESFLAKFRGKAKNIARVLTFITAMTAGEALLRAQSIPPTEAAFKQVSLAKEEASQEKVERFCDFFQHKLVELDKQHTKKTEDFVLDWAELHYKFQNVFLNELTNEQRNSFELEWKGIEDEFNSIYVAKTVGETPVDFNNQEKVEHIKSLEAFGDIVYRTPPAEPKEDALDVEIVLLSQYHVGPGDYRSEHSQELITEALKELIKNNDYKFIGTEKQETTSESIRKKEKLLKELSAKSELTDQEKKLKRKLEDILFLAPIRVIKDEGTEVVVKNVDPDYELDAKKWREIYKEHSEISYEFLELVKAISSEPNLKQELLKQDKEFSEKVIKSLEKRGRGALSSSVKEIISIGENKGVVVFGLGDAVFFKSEAQELNQNSKDFVQKIKDELGEDYFQKKYNKDIKEINLDFYVFNPRIPQKKNL